ncbi:MAG: hypothetical protein QOJ13_2873 [Gaiellales bacterium]|jgi:hypothetical protein|nr:hypothetical protein [Gaiellales bacterium]
MPRYLIERTFTVPIEDMPPIGRKSKELTEGEFSSITWEHSHIVVTDDGKVRSYCIYDAPDEDTVRQHAMALGHHVVDVLYEIAGDVSPRDYPDSKPGA